MLFLHRASIFHFRWYAVMFPRKMHSWFMLLAMALQIWVCRMVSIWHWLLWHRRTVIEEFNWNRVGPCIVVKETETEAVRYWSCPLNRNRDRIIPFRAHLLKWAKTWENHCPMWDASPPPLVSEADSLPYHSACRIILGLWIISASWQKWRC